MTEAPSRVRAVARVDAAGPPGPGPEPRRKRKPGYLGTVHVAQLVLVEAVLFGTVAALAGGPVLTAGVAALGVLIILATTLRYKGRWWFERRTMAREYRRRRRARPDPRVTEPRLAALQWLAPGLTVTDIGPDDGTRVGVACDAAGWYGVIAIGEPSAMRGEAGPGLPLEVLARALDDTEYPGAVLQVVTQSVPAPSLDMDSRHLAAHSYQELQQMAGPLPAHRTTWLALRLDARSRAEVGMAGGYDAEHAAGLLANLLRKASRSLRESGITHEILGAGALLDTLVAACDLDRAGGSAPREPAESWTAWHSGRAAHASFWVSEWPRIAGAAEMLGALSTTPSRSSTVSLVLTRDGDDLAVRCLVRVAVDRDALGQACQALTRAADAAHTELFRLDGEHGPAVYASAPTGGGAT